MRLIPIFLTLAVFTAMGCSSDSGESLATTDSMQESTLNTTDTTTGFVAFFNGATFVITDQAAIVEIPNGAIEADNWSVSFTANTVTWNQSGVVTEGTYSETDSTNSVAIFADREIDFKRDGSNIIWNSVSYSRTAISKFNSQESLEAHFNGSRYHSKELFLGGENVSDELVQGNWSIRFNNDEFFWAYQDMIEFGTYSYINGSSFNVSFSNRDITVYVLDNNELVLDSAIYAQVIIDQFDSQDTLVAFLDAASYKSVELQSAGISSNGATAVGYWYIDFTANTFSWTYEDVAEAGTYRYVDSLNLTAVLSNIEFNVEIDGNDIIWDNVRYRRVTTQ